MNIFARQKIIYATPLGGRAEFFNLPPDPRTWWVPRDNTPTSVEIVGAEPTEGLIQLARQMGWSFHNGKFYYVG